MAVRISSTGIQKLLRGDVSSFVRSLGEQVRQQAQRNSPVDTGRLRRSITVGRLAFRGNSASVKVSTNTGYGLYPEQGTGIYGPTGQVIRPKSKPFLVFQPRGLGHIIRVRSVRGQRGQHYMRDALISVIGRI
jgi:hypothetical protein